MKTSLTALAALVVVASSGLVSPAAAAGRISPIKSYDPRLVSNETVHTQLTPNIVDGTDVYPPFLYPWSAAILDEDYAPPVNALRCGGSIISTNPWIMLTVAHCTQEWFDYRGAPPSPLMPKLKVQAHRFNLDKTCAQEQCVDLKPVKATWHPNYKLESDAQQNLWPVYDFALWLLRPLPANYTRPKITIPELDSGTVTGTKLTMIGYGVTGFDSFGLKIIGPKLQKIDVTVITPPKCQQLDGIPQSPSFQCTVPNIGKGGQCSGDSGSAVLKTVVRNVPKPCGRNNGGCGTIATRVPVVVGLNSFGASDCGTQGDIIGSGQSKVAAGKTWIAETACRWGAKAYCSMIPVQTTSRRKLTTSKRKLTTSKRKLTTSKRKTTTKKPVLTTKKVVLTTKKITK